MLKPALFFILVISFFSCKNPKNQPKATVIVHGGAGYVSSDMMIPGEEEGIRDAIEKSLQISHQHLTNGGTSVEAVQIAINVLETFIVPPPPRLQISFGGRLLRHTTFFQVYLLALAIAIQAFCHDK